MRLNPDLDPNGYWDDDMYIPPYEFDAKYDDIDLEALYDLDRAEVRGGEYFAPEYKIVDRLRKQEFTWRTLFDRTPTPTLVAVQPLKPLPEFEQSQHEFIVATFEGRNIVADGEQLYRKVETKPLFEGSPAGAGDSTKKVEDSKRKTKAEKPPVGQKLTEAIEAKLKELQEVYFLDVSLERSIPYTKDLNRQLASRLTQLSSYTKQLRRSLASNKKKVLDLSTSGDVKPSKAAERVKSKGRQKSSKVSASASSEGGSQKQLLALVSQLVERLPSSQVSDFKLGDSGPVVGLPPQPLEQ